MIRSSYLLGPNGVELPSGWRDFDGDVVPAVMADWRRAHELRRMFNVPSDVIDLVVEQFIKQKSLKEDMLKFMERTGKRFQKHYSGSARRYLNMLTTTILAKEGRYPPKAKD